VHSEGPKVAAREEERAHDIGIGGEGEALPGDVEHAGIMLRFEHRIAESGQEQLADERCISLPPPP